MFWGFESLTPHSVLNTNLGDWMSDVRVIGLRAEDFLRLKVVEVHPNPTGITKVVGRNGQGKTSLLNALAAALGGGAHSPAQPIRKGADKAEVVVELTDITVRKVWKQGKTTLEVTTRDGAKVTSPQAMLDKLVGELTFDPLEFVRRKPAEQVAVLARLAGIDLAKLAADKKVLYDKRRDLGRQRDNAAGAFKALPEVEAPAEEVVVADLLAEMAKMEEVNKTKGKLAAEHKQAQVREGQAKINMDRITGEIFRLEAALAEEEKKLVNAKERFDESVAETMAAAADSEAAPIEDLAPIKQKLADSQEINRKVRANQDRAKAKKLATKLDKDYDAMTAEMTALDAARDKAVAEADFPVPGLGLTDEGVTLAGVPFEQGSQAEQLKASVAIGFALNPKLKLVLIRDGSLLDADSMQLLAEMCATAGAQCLIERVSGNGETGILISDGEVVESEPELCKGDDA